MNPDLRAILVCPVCRAALEDHPKGLVCRGEAHDRPLLFPVEDDVPMMVEALARPLDED